VVIKDKRLPDAVLRGEVGMVFPETIPFAEEDDAEVEIITDINRTNRTTKNSSDNSNRILNRGSKRFRSMTEDDQRARLLQRRADRIETTETARLDGGVTTPIGGGVDTPIGGGVEDPDVNIVQPPTRNTTPIDEQFSDGDLQLTDQEDGGQYNAEKEKVVPVPSMTPRKEIARKRKLPKRKRGKKQVEVDEEVLFISVATSERLLEAANFVGSVEMITDDFAVGKIQFDVRKALNSEYRDGFVKSVAAELGAIDKFKVMDDVLLTEIPAGTTIFRSYMLCHRKSLGAGEWKCKSRLVVDGSMCVPGLHTAEMDISTSLPGWNAMRVLCSVAKGNGWWVHAGDIRTAFLKGDPSGITVFMHMPIGLRKYKKTAQGMVEICKAVHGNLCTYTYECMPCVYN
jgi:hypothetical protein